MNRYSIITEKNKREIVLLRGTGCRWKRCSFCDYHLDFSKNEEENFKINKEVLSHVTGLYHHLEVINSGSFPELDEKTVDLIYEICKEKHISLLHFECHYLYRGKIPALREKFGKIGTELKIKIGVESFDFAYRETYLQKGIQEKDPKKIAENFNECCLLQGLDHQTVESMKQDIETGLANFERVCVNIMNENTTAIKPNPDTIAAFIRDVYPLYKDNDRVDILLHITDFGVGNEGGHPVDE